MAIEGLTSHYNDKANWTAFHALSEEQCEIVIENASEDHRGNRPQVESDDLRALQEHRHG